MREAGIAPVIGDEEGRERKHGDGGDDQCRFGQQACGAGAGSTTTVGRLVAALARPRAFGLPCAGGGGLSVSTGHVSDYR